VQIPRCLATLDRMWIDPPGYFCRAPQLPHVKFAFTNYGVSLGLQAIQQHPDRIRKLNAFFDAYRSGDEYDREAITHLQSAIEFAQRHDWRYQVHDASIPATEHKAVRNAARYDISNVLAQMPPRSTATAAKAGD
jgi:hypothetical protein